MKKGSCKKVVRMALKFANDEGLPSHTGKGSDYFAGFVVVLWWRRLVDVLLLHHH
jgi:hypothetical protein